MKKAKAKAEAVPEVQTIPPVEGDKGPDEFQIKGWAEDLLRAKEIESDEEKMALVKPYLAKKAKAINSIADLRKLREDKSQADLDAGSEASEDSASE